jgi:hypothetical protein
MQQNFLLPTWRIEDRSNEIIHRMARLSEPLCNESVLIRKARTIRAFREVPSGSPKVLGRRTRIAALWLPLKGLRFSPRRGGYRG